MIIDFSIAIPKFIHCNANNNTTYQYKVFFA